ncbi:MAG: hypothetical protein AB1758_12960, partial [Candidatus Eremiobacterota bacterium]
MRTVARALLVCLAFLAGAARAEAPASSTFTRVLPDDQGRPLALQTSVTRYRGPNNLTVDLVAVVHVGEGGYYDRLNTELRAYDAVLFELILADRKERPREEEEDPGSALSSVQTRLADLLGLEFQLARIDYRARN